MLTGMKDVFTRPRKKNIRHLAYYALENFEERISAEYPVVACEKMNNS